MSENLEIEFKTLLTETDYRMIRQAFHLRDQDFHTQTNVYFDNEAHALKNNRMGLRIRLLPTHAQLTLKTPTTNDALLETTDELTLSQAQDYLSNDRLPNFGAVHACLQRYSIDSQTLRSIGKLTTKRAEFKVPEGLLALDENWYGHAHDFELELEVTNYTEGKVMFNRLLSQLSVTYQPAKNKIQRMMEEKNSTL
ncbi:hypothetical protein IGI37_000662 [Enterococcus sp. AZ194]|uniref:CYTH domain-containing protein n=1 Tax=Enterococcus sp. AZ194 TaxID=2774629 RepID=UPI003F238460